MRNIELPGLVYCWLVCPPYWQKINKVTNVMGAGYSHLFSNTYNYVLSAAYEHKPQMQKLSSKNFVTSSNGVFRPAKLQYDEDTNKLYKTSVDTNVKWYLRLSQNPAVNLPDVNTNNLHFHKTMYLRLGFFTSNILINNH